MRFVSGYVIVKSDSPNGGPLWENNNEEFLIRFLSSYTPHEIVGALSATFDVSDLGKLAAELDDLIQYLRKCETA
jgi:hypothetical protein